MTFRRLDAKHALACIASAAGTLAHGQELDVQAPGPAVRLQGGLSTDLVYRDVVLSRDAAVFAFGGIAHNGFALSLWTAQAGSRAKASELLLAYSYKLPLLDVHAGYTYVRLSDAWDVGGGAWRVGATTNGSSDTEAELLYDRATNGGYRSTRARITQTFWTKGPLALAAQIGASRSTIPAGTAKGLSIALLVSRRISPGLELQAGLLRHVSHAPLTLTGRREDVGLNFSVVKSW